MNFEIRIDGMMCPKCEAHAKAALEKLGVSDLIVSHKDNNATFTANDLSDEMITSAIKEAGYTVTEIIKK